jgi:hypothetical protein
MSMKDPAAENGYPAKGFCGPVCATWVVAARRDSLDAARHSAPQMTETHAGHIVIEPAGHALMIGVVVDP